MSAHTKLILGIVLAWGFIAGCSHDSPPTASIADPCAIALTPHEGSSRTDENIIRLQHASRQAKQPVAHLERLGWAFVAKARSSFDPGFYTLAEQCVLCIASKQPNSSEALLLRGHVLNQLHRFRESEAIARQLVAQRGLSYDYGLLGDALTEQGKIADAVVAYDHMLQQKPSPQGYIRAAHVRWLTGDLTGAIQVMQMATNGFRDPEASAWSHVRLALYELQADHIQQATSRIAATLASQPNYAPALAAHGRLLLATGAPQEAIAPLQRAIALIHYPNRNGS